jgi:hypothetical protein
MIGSPQRPGPQPHNRIAPTADEQLAQALVELPSGMPAESWWGRHTEALEQFIQAERKIPPAAKNTDTGQRAYLKALGRVAKVESQVATEFCLMLRFADRYSGETLRAVLTEIVEDVVTGLLEPVRNDIADLARAVAALEQQAKGRRRAG